MTRKLGQIAAAINLCSVISFALTMAFSLSEASYLFSIFIAFSFVVMTACLAGEAASSTQGAASSAVIFAAAYMILVLLVYFAQLTSLRLDNLSASAQQIINYQSFGLFFNYNLLGYGLMALSTFFIGLTLEPKRPAEIWLKRLLLIHGVFFISCFIIPLLGTFKTASPQSAWIGVAVLEFWCLYFAPISALTLYHFTQKHHEA